MYDEGVYGYTRVVSSMHDSVRRHNWAVVEIEVGRAV